MQDGHLNESVRMHYYLASKRELIVCLKKLKSDNPSTIENFNSADPPQWLLEHDQIRGGGSKRFVSEKEWNSFWVKRGALQYYINPVIVGKTWSELGDQAPVLYAYDRETRRIICILNVTGEEIKTQ